MQPGRGVPYDTADSAGPRVEPIWYYLIGTDGRLREFQRKNRVEIGGPGYYHHGTMEEPCL
jgi:hypothetical protein